MADLFLDNHPLYTIVGVVDEMTITLPGPVLVRWRETQRWREVTLRPECEPMTHRERVAEAERRLVWGGAPLVEAHVQAEHMVNLKEKRA